jgi:hypothetical protein
VSISFPYRSNTGQTETLTLSLNLAAAVTNATAAESTEAIKSNAPATYYTQNRMITGEDYNITPLSASTQISKVKAINRTSSGISRYFDLADPTGKYSSTTIFADDGVIYKEEAESSTRFSYQNKTDIEGIIYNDIFDVLKDTNLKNFYYSNFSIFITSSLDIIWNSATLDGSLSTGYVSSGATVFKVGSFTSNDLKYLKTGALVKFVAPSGQYFDTLRSNVLVSGDPAGPGAVTSLWSKVVSVIDDGTAAGKGVLSTGFGAITLNTPIPQGAVITQIIPRWRTVIESPTVTTMIDLIFANKPFGLRYDAEAQQWKLVFELNLDAKNNFSLGKQGDQSNQQQDASWMVLFTTDNEFYTVTSRVQRYIFESDKQVRFYFDRSNKIYDSKTNSVIKDTVNILSINTVPNSVSPFTTNKLWDIVSEFTGLDGYVDTKKLIVAFADTDDNGIVDNPQLFVELVDPDNTEIPLANKYIIQEKYSISQGQEDYRYIDNTDQVIILNSQASVGPITNYKDGQYFYFIDKKLLVKLNSALAMPFVPSLDYKVYSGRDHLKFQYIHNADYEARIDPGASNIIDIFVLTKSYDVKYRQWLNGSISDRPLPPSSAELYDLVSSNLNLVKSISDEIIFHPVSYKVLFGSQAQEDLQATFKVIKNSNQVVSDNDIKTRVIASIDKFFALENWDFGDTFYFTELSTFVMTELSPDISSFVIVPRQGGLGFGSLFEIKSASDQIFVSGATVDDVEITTGITSTSIKSVSGTTVQTTISDQQNITSSPYGVNNGRK